ncbi:MAG: c-type cytochrome, partial [Sphingobacteriales bacterium]
SIAIMSHHRSIASSLFSGVVFVLVMVFSARVQAQDGKALFQQKCASCHAINKNLTGPALSGVEDRWPNKADLYRWIRNSAALIKEGHPRAVEVYNQYNKIQMTAFPELKDADIDAILAYINAPAPGPKGGDPIPDTVSNKAAESDSALIFGILTIILAVIALILLQVNSNLKRLSDDADGVASPEPVPFWRNKAYIALGAIVLFMFGGYLLFQGASGLGRSQKYQPEQPIYYSHTVHAGVNQISCLYCHNGAMQGKHANIPSVNVCMNCHMGINEYAKGPKLYREDGTEVDGTAEIQKLYQYAGWDPATKSYNGKGSPIEWVRIHNLPDHVYFNHAQHVTVGKQACQTCHGEIQKMGEVYQYSDLSMGWCINCHRESKVQFTDNKFYSIYEKFHEDLKNKKMDSVTVEKIGGTECMKCHY